MQFALLLARTLNKTLNELMDCMDSAEFCLWQAEYNRSPWGEFRDDLNAGAIQSTLANYAGKTRKDNLPPAKPIDFMPYYQPKPEPAKDDFESLKAMLGVK